MIDARPSPLRPPGRAPARLSPAIPVFLRVTFLRLTFLRMALPSIASLSLMCLSLLPARPAAAHGLYPLATAAVFQSPSDPAPLVQTNFGILVRQAPDNWSWVCEDVTGSSSIASFEALSTGEWFFGTTTGLWRSEDHCSWARVPPPLDALFITRLRRDTADPARLWASTSTGGQHNALYYSDDRGKSFQEFRNFGEGSTIRGFLQGPGGLPWYVFGWRDSVPYMWYSADASKWDEIRIVGGDNFSIYPLEIDAHDPGKVYLAFHSSSDDLVEATHTGQFTHLLTLNANSIMAFASGPATGQLEVGSRNLGMYRTTDGGRTWSEPDKIPEADCLAKQDDTWYQCTNNWSDNAAMMSVSPGGTDYSRLMGFGDVHQPLACPAGTQTADICGPLWETVKAAAGLDVDSTPTPPPAAGDGDQGGDAGGCACATGGPSEGIPAGVLPILMAAAATLLAWRRGWTPGARRPGGSGMTSTAAGPTSSRRAPPETRTRDAREELAEDFRQRPQKLEIP